MQYSAKFRSVNSLQQAWPRLFNILIVDDEMDSGELLQSLFQVARHTASVAHTAADAERCAKQHHFDAVYVDIKSTRMAWPGLAAGLRQLPHMAKVPLIAISAIDRYVDPRLDLGVFDHIILKPADLTAIMYPLRILAQGGEFK